MAVTAVQPKTVRHGTRTKVPVAASKHLYENTLVFANTSGFATDVVSLWVNEFLGLLVKDVDNSSGAAGDLAAEIETGGAVLLTGTGFTQATVGKPIYATDNYTITADPTAANCYVGICEEYVSTTQVVVRLNASKGRQSARTAQSVADVHDSVPTAAQCAAAFGAAASLGRGFLGSIDDADGDLHHYLISVSDASFFFVLLTKCA